LFLLIHFQNNFIWFIIPLFFAFLYKIVKFIQRWKIALSSVKISIVSEIIKKRIDINTESSLRDTNYLDQEYRLFLIIYQKCFFWYGYKNEVKGLWQIPDVESLLPKISDFKVLFLLLNLIL